MLNLSIYRAFSFWCRKNCSSFFFEIRREIVQFRVSLSVQRKKLWKIKKNDVVLKISKFLTNFTFFFLHISSQNFKNSIFSFFFFIIHHFRIFIIHFFFSNFFFRNYFFVFFFIVKRSKSFHFLVVIFFIFRNFFFQFFDAFFRFR